MTDPFPAKTMFVLSCTFSRPTGSIRVMLHLKALLTIINWKTLSNNLSSPPLSESCRVQTVPTPPPAQHGMRKRCLDPSSRSHQPLACSHLSGGGRGWGGSLQMVIWSPTRVVRFVLGKKPTTTSVCCQIGACTIHAFILLYFRYRKE